VIKVNLANRIKGGAKPGEEAIETEMDAPSGSEQAAGLGKLVLILAGAIGLFIFERIEIPKKQQTLRARQGELSKLQDLNTKAKSAVEEVKKYKTERTLLEEQINTIEGLRRDRMREVRILDLLQREIPDKMWFTRIDVRDQRITISGFASSDNDLTQFMDVLGRSQVLQNVNLVKVSESIQENTILKDFTISAQLRKFELFQNQQQGPSPSGGAPGAPVPPGKRGGAG